MRAAACAALVTALTLLFVGPLAGAAAASAQTAGHGQRANVSAANDTGHGAQPVATRGVLRQVLDEPALDRAGAPALRLTHPGTLLLSPDARAGARPADDQPVSRGPPSANGTDV